MDVSLPPTPFNEERRQAAVLLFCTSLLTSAQEAPQEGSSRPEAVTTPGDISLVISQDGAASLHSSSGSGLTQIYPNCGQFEQTIGPAGLASLASLQELEINTSLLKSSPH